MTIAAARSVFRSSAARSAASRFASQPKSAPSPFRLPSRSPLAQRLLRMLAMPVELSFDVVHILSPLRVTGSVVTNKGQEERTKRRAYFI